MSELKQQLVGIQITLAMRHEDNRGGLNVGSLPPEHWPEVLRRLQVIYRRATGERHAILTVEYGDAI